MARRAWVHLEIGMKVYRRNVLAGLHVALGLMLCLAAISKAAMASNPPPGYTRIEQDDAAIVFTGAWGSASSSAYSGGTAAYSNDAGAEAQLSFTGTAVQWIGLKGPTTGMADVLLDGIVVATVNTASKKTLAQAILYSTHGLTRASHTLAIRVKNPGKGAVWVDAFDVLPVSSDTTPPTVAVTSPAGGATVSGTITVSADASDDVGVASVQFELDDAPLGNPLTTAPYSISWDTAGTANGTHTLLAVARDAAGNIGTSQPVGITVSNTATRIEQDGPAVKYTGTWITASDPSVSGGTAVESNQANATATLSFTGTGVSWIGYRCACAAGFAEVSVDGGAPTEVDSYSATTQPQAVVFTADGLPRGNHTLTITVTGQYDRAGNSAYVVLDAFDVTD